MDEEEEDTRLLKVENKSEEVITVYIPGLEKRVVGAGESDELWVAPGDKLYVYRGSELELKVLIGSGNDPFTLRVGVLGHEFLY